MGRCETVAAGHASAPPWRAATGVRSGHAAIRPEHGADRRRRPERLRRPSRRAGGDGRRADRRVRQSRDRAGARRGLGWSSPPRTGIRSTRRTSPATVAPGRSTASPGRGAPTSTRRSTLPVDAPRVRKGANGEDGYSGFTMRDPVSGQTIPTGARNGCSATAGVGRVVVVGLATDYCVKATALDAVRLGFRRRSRPTRSRPSTCSRATATARSTSSRRPASSSSAARPERGRAASPGRRDLRAVPRPFRAPSARSSDGTASSCPASRGWSSSSSTCSARRARRTSAAPPTG